MILRPGQAKLRTRHGLKHRLQISFRRRRKLNLFIAALLLSIRVSLVRKQHFARRRRFESASDWSLLRISLSEQSE